MYVCSGIASGGSAEAIVGRVLLDVKTVLYVPPLFSAKNEPKLVRNSFARALLLPLYSVSDFALMNL